MKKSEVKSSKTVKTSKSSKSSKKNTFYLGVNIPDELNNRLVDYSNRIGIPKTSLVILALNNYLNINDNMDTLKKAVGIYEKEK